MKKVPALLNKMKMKAKSSAPRTFAKTPRIKFLGGVGTVTGSKYLIEFHDKKIMIDCGLFQGLKELRLRNWAPLPVEPANIDAVILTHAHIDHTGYIPLLVKNGFKGKIYCTYATKDLCSILLPDSGYLQEEAAKYAKRKGFSKHKKPLPLYTKRDAVKSLRFFSPVDFGTEYDLFEGIKFKINRVGHILGAGAIKVTLGEKSILFSGDLGRMEGTMMVAPEKIDQDSDYIVIESTYGGREHKDIDPLKKLEKVINNTVTNGGSLVIPAFAVGRSQHILYRIMQLKKAGKIPDVPIYLDSPMSIKVTNLLENYPNEHILSREESAEMYRTVNFSATVDQSKAINKISKPIIVVSASGMATGGRILHHIKQFAPNKNSTILFAGYQAMGTRGRDMIEGKKEVKIHGQMVPIKAKIEVLNNISAHADFHEILEWLGTRTKKPTKVFITHGEEDSALSMKKKIENKMGWKCVIPEYLQSEEL
jgi:metallo-beta-lactamase family protein